MSGNSLRNVLPEADAPVSLPPMLTCARSLSNASSSSCRFFDLVPRISMAPVNWPSACLPNADFSSAKCSDSVKLTPSPRVFFGSSATFMPLGNAKRCVRASRLAMLVSKVSPSVAVASPL